MVSPQAKGWVIGEYTGDPYKDYKISFGTTALANNLATVVVDGKIVCAIAIGSTAGAAELGVACTSTAAQLAGGTAVFTGSASATDTIHYFIVHKGLK